MNTVTNGIPVANLIIRGNVFSDHLIDVGGRGGDLNFRTPDINAYLDRLPLGNPDRLSDLYELSFNDILDYLEELGSRLDIESNPYLQHACELTYMTAPMSPALVDSTYANLGEQFQRDIVTEAVERTVGVRYLEDWVEHEQLSGKRVSIRCFGARTLHIVAGNSPSISALSIVRNAVLRSDAIIKAPSNDPFTALAIAQTMVGMAPDHPVTKHLSVGYWRGGDAEVEDKLYQPHNIEKIIAWGGFASVKHITQYIQPGLEVISLDPKSSASIIGAETFQSEDMINEAAIRAAADMGIWNQVGCLNARVVYVMSGTDEDGLEKINRLGRLVYKALMELPPHLSTKPKKYDRDLKSHVDALRLDDEWFHVIGGEEDEGAVIVSQIPEAVAFATKLADRTLNLVPVDSIDEIVGAVNAYTQTVGVYPDSLKAEIVDRLSLLGAQRFCSLGYATLGSVATPQDGIEPLRRMGKWIINEDCDPAVVPPPWLATSA